ncbi:MAG: hypothetical protein ACRCWG_12400 [Sarcina sp.]
MLTNIGISNKKIYKILDKYIDVCADIKELSSFENLVITIKLTDDIIKDLEDNNYFKDHEILKSIVYNKKTIMTNILTNLEGETSSVSDTILFYNSFNSIVHKKNYLREIINHDNC